MSNDVQIEGMEAVFQMLDRHVEDIHDACQQIVEETVIDTDADTKQSLTDQGAVDTGRLRSSYHFTIGDLEATEGTNVDYSVFIEHGTRFMRARPHLFPSFEKNRMKFIEKCKAL